MRGNKTKFKYEQKLSTFGAKFLEAYHFYEKTTRAVSWIFHNILLVFFVLNFDHLLKSYDHLDFGYFWPNLRFLSEFYHQQKVQKNLQIHFSSFQSGLKKLFFTIFWKIVTSRVR